MIIPLCYSSSAFISANIIMERWNVHHQYAMDFYPPTASYIDESYSENRTLCTPTFPSVDSTQMSFDSLDDFSWNFLTDSAEKTDAPPIFDNGDIPINLSSNIIDSFSELDSEEIFDWKDPFNQSTLHRSESCPERTDWSTSVVTTNEESSDVDDLIIQDILSRKIRPPKLQEFLRLLLNNERYSSYASWLNKNTGLFKIHKHIKVASLWRRIKARKTTGSLNYDTFARSIRSYYKPGIMCKTHIKHTYRFAHV